MVGCRRCCGLVCLAVHFAPYVLPLEWLRIGMLFSSREVGRCVGALGNETRAVYVLGRYL